MKQTNLSEYESFGNGQSDKTPCPTCGELFSENGVAAHHWQVHGEKIREEVDCDHCGKTLQRKPSNIYGTNFCNDEHMYAYQQGENHHNYNSVKTKCLECGGQVERNKSHIGDIGAFCDHDCYGQWLSRERSGQDATRWRGGVSHTDAIRKNLSRESWDTIAEQIRKDANRVCEMCGGETDQKRLDVHHIVPLVSGGTNHRENLMALCDACHNKAEAFIRQYPEFDPVLIE